MITLLNVLNRSHAPYTLLIMYLNKNKNSIALFQMIHALVIKYSRVTCTVMHNIAQISTEQQIKYIIKNHTYM